LCVIAVIVISTIVGLVVKIVTVVLIGAVILFLINLGTRGD
jgi:hypothetical protein